MPSVKIFADQAAALHKLDPNLGIPAAVNMALRAEGFHNSEQVRGAVLRELNRRSHYITARRREVAKLAASISTAPPASSRQSPAAQTPSLFPTEERAWWQGGH